MNNKMQMCMAVIRNKLPIIPIKSTSLRRVVKAVCAVGVAIANINQICGIIFLNRLIIPQLDFVITTKCSLRCKNCADLMPYFKCPENRTLEDLQKEMDKLLECVDSINEVVVLGGEPFLHPDINQVLSYLVGLNKVKSVVIFTNGTIVPKREEVIKVLKNKKIQILISDYGKVSRNKDKLLQLSRERGFSCKINFIPLWASFGKLHRRNRNESQLIKQFRSCDIPCRTYFEGKFHYCERSAMGTALGYIPSTDDDYVDIINGNYSRDEVRKRIIDLSYAKSYIEACRYCDKGTLACVEVPIAEQLENGEDL